MDEMRKAFEAWATAEPREWDISRFDESAPWPGNYRSYPTQCAWEAWQAACAAERKGSAMTRGNILRIAVECGFKLRPQGDGSLDLNPYVYRFAEALIEAQAAKDEALLRQTLDALDQAYGWAPVCTTSKRILGETLAVLRARLEETK